MPNCFRNKALSPGPALFSAPVDLRLWRAVAGTASSARTPRSSSGSADGGSTPPPTPGDDRTDEVLCASQLNVARPIRAGSLMGLVTWKHVPCAGYALDLHRPLEYLPFRRICDVERYTVRVRTDRAPATSTAAIGLDSVLGRDGRPLAAPEPTPRSLLPAIRTAPEQEPLRVDRDSGSGSEQVTRSR